MALVDKSKYSYDFVALIMTICLLFAKKDKSLNIWFGFYKYLIIK